MKKFNFIYKTTNLINGKTYIGVHSTNKLLDGYIGCGVYSQAHARCSKNFGYKSAFINAVIKYNYDNFYMEILCFYNNIEDAYKYETLIVDKHWVRSSENYNTSLGGKGYRKISSFEDVKLDIQKDFINNMTIQNIRKKYKCSAQTVFNMLQGLDRSLRKIKKTKKQLKKEKVILSRKLNTKIAKHKDGMVFEFITFKEASIITGIPYEAVRWAYTSNKYKNNWIFILKHK